ncbi:hypothetical protein [Halosimplex pelagicum]|uniref:Uncharacterized protein n=1 Tax=Halosimplex pelagicum TaxID=869886 RepID=A0A7D5TB38_9EURY|nr:hypothetical protein [Halosimplex pelagicum]QLH83350.1 hypothetical protein HZS54_17690 [Halosimplex pelagicum]
MGRSGDGTGDGYIDGTAKEAFTYHVELGDTSHFEAAAQAANEVGAVWYPSESSSVLKDKELQEFNALLESPVPRDYVSLGDTGTLIATSNQKSQFASILGTGFTFARKVAEGDADGDGTSNEQEMTQLVNDRKHPDADGGGGDNGDGQDGLNGLLSGLPVPELLPGIGPFGSKTTTLLAAVLVLAVISTVTGG